MRKLRFTLLSALALGAFTLTSCDKEEPQGPVYDLKVIGFEDAQLPAAGYEVKDGNAYSEGGIDFAYTYSESEYEGVVYLSWTGFVVSNNKDKSTAGFGNQYSVYGDGGQGGSKQFGVCHITSDNAPQYGSFSFAGGAVYEIDHLYVNNSTYAALSMRDGDDYAKKFAAGDWFKLTATGYDADDKETASKELFLADYTAGKSQILSNWTKVPLASLGKVNKVVFTLSSTDSGERGMNTPAYVCVDNIAYRVYPEETE